MANQDNQLTPAEAATRVGMDNAENGVLVKAPARAVIRQRIVGYLFAALALVTCPCHLPILLVLLAGTTAGAYLGEHWGIAALAMTALFVLSVARVLRIFGGKS